MKHYETPSVLFYVIATEDVVRTSPTSDTLEFDANGFIGGVQ